MKTCKHSTLARVRNLPVVGLRSSARWRIDHLQTLLRASSITSEHLPSERTVPRMGAAWPSQLTTELTN